MPNPSVLLGWMDNLLISKIQRTVLKKSTPSTIVTGHMMAMSSLINLVVILLQNPVVIMMIKIRSSKILDKKCSIMLSKVTMLVFLRMVKQGLERVTPLSDMVTIKVLSREPVRKFLGELS